MKASEKLKTLMKLLSEQTWNLGDEYSASISHIKFDYNDCHIDEYKVTFFNNRPGRWIDSEILTILSTAKSCSCYSYIGSKHGEAVVEVIIR